MSTRTPVNTDVPKKFTPYVPEDMEMREFTPRAVLLGLLLTVVLGAANAYLGLRAGITIAASEIHKAGRRGAEAAKYLFWKIGVGGLVYMMGRFGLFAADKDLHFAVGNLGHSQVRLGPAGNTSVVAAGGTSMVAAPSVSPAYLGVGYIIGLRLASLQFAGGVLARGLMVPFFVFVLEPQLKQFLPADTPDHWAAIAAAVWRFIVRPIAVGGMLVGAA